MKKLALFTLVLTSFVICSTQASSQIVNMLGWVGSLTPTPALKKAVRKIEHSCNATISYDSYSNYSDFSRQFNGKNHQYDIVVASNTYVNQTRRYIPNTPNPTLHRYVEQYNPLVRKHFYKLKLPQNAVLYQLSLTGLLLNEKNIKLNNKSSLASLFKQAGNKYQLLILDDPIEVAYLIQNSYFSDRAGPLSEWRILRNIRFFTQLVINHDVTLVDFFNYRMADKNFGAAFTWSGDALVDLHNLHSPSSYAFKLLPQLSYVSSDLLIQMNNKPATRCIMTKLASPSFLNLLSQSTRYFSPYTTKKSIIKSSPDYIKLQKQYLDYLKSDNWLDTVKIKDFNKILLAWQKVKYEALRTRVHDVKR